MAEVRFRPDAAENLSMSVIAKILIHLPWDHKRRGQIQKAGAAQPRQSCCGDGQLEIYK